MTTATPQADPKAALCAAVDILVVLVFVTIGRRNHQESSAIADIARTAAPFLLALAPAWFVARAWRTPLRLGTGAIVWAVTLIVGMMLRRVLFDDGTATPFIIVATLFLGASFLGWRLVAAQVERRRAPVTAR